MVVGFVHRFRLWVFWVSAVAKRVLHCCAPRRKLCAAWSVWVQIHEQSSFLGERERKKGDKKSHALDMLSCFVACKASRSYSNLEALLLHDLDECLRQPWAVVAKVSKQVMSHSLKIFQAMSNDVKQTPWFQVFMKCPELGEEVVNLIDEKKRPFCCLRLR